MAWQWAVGGEWWAVEESLWTATALFPRHFLLIPAYSFERLLHTGAMDATHENNGQAPQSIVHCTVAITTTRLQDHYGLELHKASATWPKR